MPPVLSKAKLVVEVANCAKLALTDAMAVAAWPEAAAYSAALDTPKAVNTLSNTVWMAEAAVANAAKTKM